MHFPPGSCSIWLLRFQFCKVSQGFFRKEEGVETGWASELFKKCSWLLYSQSHIVVTLCFTAGIPTERLDVFKVALFSCFSDVGDFGENKNDSWPRSSTSLIFFFLREQWSSVVFFLAGGGVRGGGEGLNSLSEFTAFFGEQYKKSLRSTPAICPANFWGG